VVEAGRLLRLSLRSGVGDLEDYDSDVIAGKPGLEVDDLCHEFGCEVAGSHSPAALEGGQEAVFVLELAAASRLGHTVGVEEQAVAWL
jgi:hypothetical protein